MEKSSYQMPTPEMQLYFQSLPTAIQENLKQAAAVPPTLDALKTCANHLMNT